MQKRDDMETGIRTQMMRADDAAVLWETSAGLTPYDDAVARMEALAQAIHKGETRERVWLVEHPALFTAGTSADDGDLKDTGGLPVFRTGRGGQYTYHGPGQRIAYVMLDLSRRRQDVRLFVATLEQWIINTLGEMNLLGERREDRVGVWLTRPEKAPLPDGTPREDKIAAIGIRLKKWVTFHGISLNVEPDLSHYEGIVACGVQEHGVTSLVDMGLPVTMEDADQVLRSEFEKLFGLTVLA